MVDMDVCKYIRIGVMIIEKNDIISLGEIIFIDHIKNKTISRSSLSDLWGSTDGIDFILSTLRGVEWNSGQVEPMSAHEDPVATIIESFTFFPNVSDEMYAESLLRLVDLTLSMKWNWEATRALVRLIASFNVTTPEFIRSIVRSRSQEIIQNKSVIAAPEDYLIAVANNILDAPSSVSRSKIFYANSGDSPQFILSLIASAYFGNESIDADIIGKLDVSDQDKIFNKSILSQFEIKDAPHTGNTLKRLGEPSLYGLLALSQIAPFSGIRDDILDAIIEKSIDERGMFPSWILFERIKRYPQYQ